MFELDRDLKAIILENLTEDGMSISALSRLLNEKGIKLHRLELSGYLKALSDMNVLRSRDVKPSIVFSLSSAKRKNVYQILGEAVEKEEEDDDKRANIALYSLCKLLRRAVFEKELKMCGLTGRPNARPATDKERQHAATAACKAGMKVSINDIALVSNANLNPVYTRVLGSMLIELDPNLKNLVAETMQKTLEEE